MFTLSDTTNNSPNKWNFVFLLAQPPMSPVLRALASPKGLKGKNPRLQHQSEQFWVAQKPTKGGGALKFFELLLKVLDFFLSIL